jgi:hypothetical protein
MASCDTFCHHLLVQVSIYDYFQTLYQSDTSEQVTVTATAYALDGQSSKAAATIAGVRKLTVNKGFAYFRDFRIKVGHKLSMCQWLTCSGVRAVLTKDRPRQISTPLCGNSQRLSGSVFNMFHGIKLEPDQPPDLHPCSRLHQPGTPSTHAALERRHSPPHFDQSSIASECAPLIPVTSSCLRDKRIESAGVCSST